MSPLPGAVPEAPMMTKCKQQQQQQQHEAILFLPGMGVDNIAYAKPALLLLDQAFVVEVVLAEPCHIPSIIMGYDAVYMQQIQRTVEQQQQLTAGNSTPCHWLWIILGHSLGLLTMIHLTATMPGMNQVIMWGSVPFSAHVCDLRAAIYKHVLIAQGSYDQGIKMVCTAHAATTKKDGVEDDLMQQFYHKFPLHMTTVQTVPGRTHLGFASYTSGWKPKIETDTTPQQQQVQAVFMDGQVSVIQARNHCMSQMI